MRRVGVRHDQLGERVVLQLGEEVQARGALQIVEPVAVLQLLELVLEHEVEGRAQQAAERHLLLGQAADPEVDVVETGRRVHAVRPTFAQAPVLLRKSRRSAGRRPTAAKTRCAHGRRALAGERGRAGDRADACRRRQ